MDLMLSTRSKLSVPNLEPLPRLLRSRQVGRSPSNQISKIILSGGLVSAFPFIRNKTTVRNFRRPVDHLILKTHLIYSIFSIFPNTIILSGVPLVFFTHEMLYCTGNHRSFCISRILFLKIDVLSFIFEM